MTTPDAYTFDDDRARVDRDVVWSFLGTDAYWGRWRDRDTVLAQLDGAWRVYAAFGFRPPDGTMLERPATLG